MKIVLLDGGAVNPGDLSWDGIRALSDDVAIYDYTDTQDVLPRMQGCELLITNKVPITREIIDATPTLQYICVTATGYNNIDTAYAADRHIPVCNIPAYSTDSVAQLTMALLLEMANGVGKNNESVHQGDWVRSKLYTYSVTPQTELTGKTFGIVGFGHIGQAVAKLAHAFGMRVIVHNRTKREVLSFVEFVDMGTLLQQSDVVSLHTALTVENQKLFNAAAFAKMKPSAFLINTARGGLIDEPALVEALTGGEIACAALDVITKEPMEPDSILLHAPHLILTPHIAFTTKEARMRLMQVLEENVKMCLAGTPQNVIN